MIAGLTGLASFAAGSVIGVFSVYDLMRYAPYSNPGDGTLGFRLAAVAAIMTGLPVAVFFACAVIRAVMQYRAWLKTLTPRQRMIARAVQFAAMESVHVAWRDHNREVDRKLSASVMGADGPEDAA
jgi:hypothetical protein